MDIIEQAIYKITKAQKIVAKQHIQDLWAGYGSITRYTLLQAAIPSVIIKHSAMESSKQHPKGWDSTPGQQRKIKSYQVERFFYTDISMQTTPDCKVPRCYGVFSPDNALQVLVLEDLQNAGYPLSLSSLEKQQMKVVLRWLAYFHARFMGVTSNRLWEKATYWHIDTRSQELEKIKQTPLAAAAKPIADILDHTPYKTIIHGDAKLANFCFSEDKKKVAAVDFQYTGSGCGIKDVAYFLSSCLSAEDAVILEKELLDYYFDALSHALQQQPKDFPIQDICNNWRRLYPFAWADFIRFLKGWSPKHPKINTYSQEITDKVVRSMQRKNAIRHKSR